MRRLLVLIAAALIAAGLTVGFAVPVSSGNFDCGTAFTDKSDLDELVDTMWGGTGTSGCDEARSAAATLPVVLLILGGVLGVGAPFAAPATSRRRIDDPTSVGV